MGYHCNAPRERHFTLGFAAYYPFSCLRTSTLYRRTLPSPSPERRYAPHSREPDEANSSPVPCPHKRAWERRVVFGGGSNAMDSDGAHTTSPAVACCCRTAERGNARARRARDSGTHQGRASSSYKLVSRSEFVMRAGQHMFVKVQAWSWRRATLRTSSPRHPLSGAPCELTPPTWASLPSTV